MENNKTKGWLKAVLTFKRIYYSLNNYRVMNKNPDFKEFGLLEYGKVVPEDIQDLKRLTYVKHLEMARKGQISKELTSRLKYLKEKEHFVSNDHKIVPVGIVKVMEGENNLTEVQFGYDIENRTFNMASNSHENIPLWKLYDPERVQKHFAYQHPQAGKELRLEHMFLEKEIHQTPKKDWEKISEFYNEVVQQSFHSSTYFKNSILIPDEGLMTKSAAYMNRQFHLRLSDDNATIMTLTEATDRYFVFQSYLKSAPNPESLYFDKQEFKERFLDSAITVLANLKHDLCLGVQNGVLQIGKYEKGHGKAKLRWDSFTNRIASKSISRIETFYVSTEVIGKKNFFEEKSAIVLQSNGKEACLKKHYGTGQWYFSEVQDNQKEDKFKPIDSRILQYINSTYSQSKNYQLAVAQVHKNNDAERVQIRPS